MARKATQIKQYNTDLYSGKQMISFCQWHSYDKIKANSFQYSASFGVKMASKAGPTSTIEHYNQSQTRDLSQNEPQKTV